MNSGASYRILRERVDFVALPDNVDKGTRTKKYVSTTGGRKAIFKYDTGSKFRGSEDCSEKIASELAKVLGYRTADIDLAVGKNGERGLLSYLFVDKAKDEVHIDMGDFLKVTKENEAELYTIKKIEILLKQEFPDVSLADFLRIIFFDALVGERDRHAENWGITIVNGKRSISPIYDTAACLLRDFLNEDYARSFADGRRDFDKYISKNVMAIHREDGGQYVPTETVVDYLLENYPEDALHEINNLNKLTDEKIFEIVERIPGERMHELQKDYIVKYLLGQRDKIKQKGVLYEK